MESDRLTRFVARYIPGVLIDCLGFGLPTEQHDDRSRRTVYEFRPGQLFAVVRWRRYDEDRQHRALAIVEAVTDPHVGHEMPGIHPPPIVHAMVDQHGPAGQGGAVDALLDLIQDMKHRREDPAKLPPDYWRAAACRIMLCQPPHEAGVGDVIG